MTAFPSEVEHAGRKYSLREIGLGDMFDLVEAAGNSAGNAAWMYLATRVCSVSAIDGVPVLMPSTKKEVKDLANRIGTDAYAAIDRVINEAGKEPAEAEDQTAKN